MPASSLLLLPSPGCSPRRAAPRPPAPTPKPAPSGPFVVLELTQDRATLGTITIALDAEKAPLSVENFLKYVRAATTTGRCSTA